MKEKEKKVIIKKIKQKIEESKVIILTDYRGMTVKEVSTLKGLLKKANAEYRVLKNTLFSLALEGYGKEERESIRGLLSGPIAVTFGFGDPGVPAKILSKFISDYEKPAIKGGLFEGKFLSQDEIKAIARLPEREVLYSQVVAQIGSPIYGLMNALNSPLRGFLYVLDGAKNRMEVNE